MRAMGSLNNKRSGAITRRRIAGRSRCQPLLAFAAVAVARLLIKPVQDGLLRLLAKRATAVMTNVPGSAVALKFCGATLRQTMFWVPAWSTSGVGVSILLYGGGVHSG